MNHRQQKSCMEQRVVGGLAEGCRTGATEARGPREGLAEVRTPSLSVNEPQNASLRMIFACFDPYTPSPYTQTHPPQQTTLPPPHPPASLPLQVVTPGETHTAPTSRASSSHLPCSPPVLHSLLDKTDHLPCSSFSAELSNRKWRRVVEMRRGVVN